MDLSSIIFLWHKTFFWLFLIPCRTFINAEGVGLFQGGNTAQCEPDGQAALQDLQSRSIRPFTGELPAGISWQPADRLAWGLYQGSGQGL
jgi:hypothetical protein